MHTHHTRWLYPKWHEVFISLVEFQLFTVSFSQVSHLEYILTSSRTSCLHSTQDHVYLLIFSSFQNYKVPFQHWMSKGCILCYLKLLYRYKLQIVLTMLWYRQGKCVCLCFPLRIYHLIWDSKRSLKSIILGTANRPKIIHTNQKSILKLLIACKFVSNKTKNPYLFLCHLHQSENKLNLDCSQSR